MNTIEEKLWNYIDGTCTPDEQKAISILIAEDETYQLTYDELLLLNKELSGAVLDEPSMAFTYNVMEAVRAEHARQPLKANIDSRIIKGITGFFALAIISLLIYVLSEVHVSVAGVSVHMPASVKIPDVSSYFNSRLLFAFLFFDAVLGMFLFDAYLRKRNFTSPKQDRSV